MRDHRNLLGLGTLPLGAFAIPLTLLTIVGFLNALNMADGADGVAGTTGLILTASLLSAAQLANITPPPALPLLAACLLAFLFYNFPFHERRRAKLFMGDSGALMIGAILAGSALQLVADHRGGASPIPPILIAALLAPPVFDCLLLMGRRLSKGRSPMSPDRDHLHHIFERAGLGKRSTVLAIAAYLIVNATVALGLWQLGLPQRAYRPIPHCLCPSDTLYAPRMASCQMAEGRARRGRGGHRHRRGIGSSCKLIRETEKGKAF